MKRLLFLTHAALYSPVSSSNRCDPARCASLRCKAMRPPRLPTFDEARLMPDWARASALESRSRARS